MAWLLLVLLSLLVPSPSHAQIANLVSLWAFDENTGTTPQDGVGSNHGTFCAAGRAPTWSTTRARGISALSFANASNQCVTVGTSSTLVPAKLTLTAWVNPTSYPVSNHSIVQRGVVDGAVKYVLRLNSSGAVNCNAGPLGSMTSTGTVATGVWTHVACVFEGSGGVARAYLNGVADATTGAMSGDFASESTNTTYLGSSPNSTPNAFNGLIDSVRLYSAALTAQAVVKDYNLPRRGLPYGLR